MSFVAKTILKISNCCERRLSPRKCVDCAGRGTLTDTSSRAYHDPQRLKYELTTPYELFFNLLVCVGSESTLSVRLGGSTHYVTIRYVTSIFIDFLSQKITAWNGSPQSTKSSSPSCPLLCRVGPIPREKLHIPM